VQFRIAIRTEGSPRRIDREGEHRLEAPGDLRTDPLHAPEIVDRRERSPARAGIEDPLREGGSDAREAVEIRLSGDVDPDPTVLGDARGRIRGRTPRSIRLRDDDEERIASPFGGRRTGVDEADDEAEGEESDHGEDRAAFVRGEDGAPPGRETPALSR
jgi:hypothetical protein